jgi:hypothetical protein
VEEEAEVKRKADEEEVEVKRKADEEAERKWKAEEVAEQKRKADNKRYQREVGKQQEKYKKDKADKAEKARKKEEVKQKKLKESMSWELQGRMTATMGPGAHEAGLGTRKKRKRTEGNDNNDFIDDSQNRSAGAPVVPKMTGPSKAPAVPDSNGFVCFCCKMGGHACRWDENKASLRCHGLHLGCKWLGMGGKEKAGVKKPWVGVMKKNSGEPEDV